MENQRSLDWLNPRICASFPAQRMYEPSDGECCVPGGCHGLQNRCCQVILGLVGSIPALSARFSVSVSLPLGC